MECGILNATKYLEQMFDIIRIVDPLNSEVIEMNLGKSNIVHNCYEFWKEKKTCTNCISTRAYQENQTIVKIEYNKEKLYWVMAAPIQENGNRYVLETLRDITNSSIVENVDKKTVKELKEEIAYMNALVVTDELTGCFNRRYINERLEIDVTQTRNKKVVLNAVMLDIDFFKHVNDRYGHLVGDEILREIGGVIRSKLRKGIDWVARYGGEEFLLIIHQQNQQEVISIVEEIRKTVADRVFYYEGEEVKVTLSAGIAQVTQEIDERDKLIEAADHKLYEAKLSGRNQIKC
ncbi:MAG: GGDEF domain-containing protein [Cellulosilyticaceae bacterium]